MQERFVRAANNVTNPALALASYTTSWDVTPDEVEAILNAGAAAIK